MLRLDHFETVLTPVGEEAMAWNIGDHGFEMVLGTYVPHIIDEHITGALEPLLARDPSLAGRAYQEIEHWAVHPGGRSIVDKVEARLELRPEQVTASRETLRDYGNMSSATILFVLKNILEQPLAEGSERVCGMAFGPGLTVETGLMTKVAADSAREADPPVSTPSSPAGAPPTRRCSGRCCATARPRPSSTWAAAGETSPALSPAGRRGTGTSCRSPGSTPTRGRTPGPRRARPARG